MNPIKQSLDAKRFDGHRPEDFVNISMDAEGCEVWEGRPIRLPQLVTCEKIAEVKPRDTVSVLLAVFWTLVIGCGMGFVTAYLLVWWMDSSLDKMLR